VLQLRGEGEGDLVVQDKGGVQKKAKKNPLLATRIDRHKESMSSGEKGKGGLSRRKRGVSKKTQHS